MPQAKSALVCIGEVMAEIRAQPGGFHVSFAGDTYNTAVYCHCSLQGLGSADYVTRIGEDPLSEGFITAALAEGLERGLIRRDPERQIGIYTVSTDAQGERSFHYWRDTSAARRMFDATIADANPQRMLADIAATAAPGAIVYLSRKPSPFCQSQPAAP